MGGKSWSELRVVENVVSWHYVPKNVVSCHFLIYEATFVLIFYFLFLEQFRNSGIYEGTHWRNCLISSKHYTTPYPHDILGYLGHNVPYTQRHYYEEFYTCVLTLHGQTSNCHIPFEFYGCCRTRINDDNDESYSIRHWTCSTLRGNMHRPIFHRGVDSSAIRLDATVAHRW